MKPTILRGAVIFTTSLILVAYFGVLVPVTYFFSWNLPIWVFSAWIFGIPVLVSILFSRFERRVSLEGLGEKSDWEIVVNAIVAVFAIGGGMIAYSLAVSPPSTTSSCSDPQNVTVTSLSCRTIQTISKPTNDFYLQAGKAIVVTGLISILVLALWIVVFYAFHRIERRKGDETLPSPGSDERDSYLWEITVLGIPHYTPHARFHDRSPR